MTIEAAHPARPSGHVHLRVTQVKPSTRPRWLVLGLTALASALFVVAFFLPWWRFWLYAPQYPGGLQLVISLRGMAGDVHEIDLLNHYIGMGHLEDAGSMEIHYAALGVAVVVLISMLAMFAAGRKLNWLIALPALLFPVGFIADSFYWLWTFGHHLNPRAPLKIPGFTPQLFGNGKIGQFETFAQPGAGFWIALVASAIVVTAAVLRARVCANCGHAAKCTAACPRLFVVLPELKGEEGK